MKRHSVYEVFTPTTQARLNFVDRAQVNDPLVDALRTPGKQVVVYGESGSGKSTLVLKKLDELYSAHITTRCSASSTFTNILLDAFDQLERPGELPRRRAGGRRDKKSSRRPPHLTKRSSARQD